MMDYLQYQTVHAPNTIIKDVKMLMPGHYFTYSNGKLNCEKYWDISSNRELVTDRLVAKKNIKKLLLKSVESRLVADVPFGAFLSGGIDSSILVGLMKEVSTSKINTFSITFNEQEFSEEQYSSLIAKKFDTEHHKIELTVDHFLKELPNALSAMDHPSGDGPNTYVVSKATKSAGVTMALSGLGGDELFAGYDIFKRSSSLLNNSILQNSPQLIRGGIGRVIASIKKDISANKISEVLNLSELSLQNFYPVNRKIFLDKELQQMVPNINFDNQVYNTLNRELNDKLPLLSQVSVSEISTYMQNVLLRDSDQMSMASALEVRVPFLDHKLVEYALSISDEIKYPNTPKHLLVDSVGSILPSEIVNRPKMGFTFPWAYWMKNELSDFCLSRLVTFKQRRLVNEEYIDLLWNRFLKGDKTVNWSRIWGIVVLENWLQENKIE
jgi:asparagine synthase (glutamine-hydrolysing)